MAIISFKCPNCDGELIFDPATQKYKCEYCNSLFTQEELDAMKPMQGEEPDAVAQEQAGGERADETAAVEQTAGERESEPEGEAVYYSCPSCGAEIVTDATTAATFCYYCHNPVVLSGRLSGEFAPDHVIPFQIDRDKAKEIFAQWIKKKKYVVDEFYSSKQVESMTGVYFPYWLYGCKVDGVLDAEAVAIEKEQLRELLEGEINEKRSYCIRQARRRFYGDSPAGIERNGYLDEVDGLTADAVTRAYARMVEQAQIEVFVLGADVDAVAQRLRTALSGLRRRSCPRPSPCPPKSRAALKNRCPPCRASCACCSHRASPLRRRTFPRCGWPWRCWAVRPPRACSRTCAKSRACAITARRPTLRSPARCVWTAAWSTPTPRRPGSPS